MALRSKAPSRSIVVAVVMIVFTMASSTTTQACDRSILESQSRSFELLRAEQDHRDNPECIALAIKGVLGTKDRVIIDVLLKYLDFRNPTSTTERMFRRHLITNSEIFPAIGALSFAQEAAIPALVNFIAAGKGTEISRRNALETYMIIFGDDPSKGISKLQEEALKRADLEEYERLLQAAKDAVLPHHDKDARGGE